MGLKTDAEVAGVGVVLALLAFVYFKDKIAAVAEHPVKAVGEWGADQVQDAGDLLGIPRTNETECEKALREGRTWDASFACPAGTFIGSVFK
ncbi:hypothetical protein [Duganella violaceipulchra]|uniref:Uncharacterized protein n=1 Tax=Duganella violaceipulchra TaxID=2849652 RepID=A0AA41HBR9_9BURK|nr:hypothetical protein [Duganella violaceicalia]MBV6324359.1 hypothetical protein [Duganella violaceicalia]MCP2007248.1 hypothetical protein [Duganella violaceicalia]